MEIRCVNLRGYPTEEVYICLQETDDYKRIIPLYKLLNRDKLVKLDILFRDCRIKGDEWLDLIGITEDEILSLYFASPEGKAELLFRELVDIGLLPRPENGYITLKSKGKIYRVEIETLKLFINGKEGCFQCDEDLPHFDRLIALCLTIIHNPEKLEVRG